MAVITPGVLQKSHWITPTSTCWLCSVCGEHVSDGATHRHKPTTRDTPEADPYGHTPDCGVFREATEFQEPVHCTCGASLRWKAAVAEAEAAQKPSTRAHAEHDRQSSAGTHLFDEGCPYCLVAMTTRDTPEAALAAALAGIGASDIDTMIWSPFLWPHPEDADVPLDPYPFASLAAAILDAIDGWTLVPSEFATTAWTPGDVENLVAPMRAENARLRTALALIASGNRTRMCRLGEGMADIARTALSQEVSDD